MYSAALTASAAQQYNIQPGQSFSITAGGVNYNLVYADVVPATYNGVSTGSRIYIYDPNGTLGKNNFEQSVTSINGGPVVMGQSGVASMLPNPGGSIGDQVLWAITLALSWAASAVMWLMQIAQQILYEIEIAISPVFVACLMVPALTHLAKRYFMLLIGICLWPLAWAICDLVTKFLIDLAVNPSNNVGLGIASAVGTLGGPLAGLAYLIVIAIWVIGSTVLAPVFIGVLLAIGGGTATAAIFGATLGAAVTRSVQTALATAGGVGGVASVIGGIGSNGSAPISAQSASRMSAYQNYASRPIASKEEPKA
jgi:hypothetical protein